MGQLEILQWAGLGGSLAIVLAGIGHLHLRILEIERQIVDIARSLKLDHDKGLSDLWTARDRDREQRERDLKEASDFRQYVLTHLATKDDFGSLETRIAGTVRMVINERLRQGNIGGQI